MWGRKLWGANYEVQIVGGGGRQSFGAHSVGVKYGAQSG